ncbi:MAG: hypothetical protein AAGI69_12045 [Cyanobacteria bacterium P01_H01_bin.21]
MGRASIIEAYIQRLLAWNKPITPAILKAIANEMGITQGELDAINLKVKAHLTRGRNFVEFGCLDNAIDELNQAKSLNPADLEVLRTLAEIHNLRYTEENSLADREYGLLIAQRCLELKPNDKEALALIKSLERDADPKDVARQTKPNIFLLIGFLEVLFNPKKISRLTKTRIALLVLFLGHTFRQQKRSRWTPQSLVVLTGGVAAVAIGWANIDRFPIFSDSASETVMAADAELEVESEFDPGPNVPVTFSHPGLFIEPRLSRLGEYKGEPYYKFYGVVINDSGQAIRKLALKVELLDGNGNPISTLNEATVTEGEARIGHGDARPLRVFHRITPELISVRVSVTDIEQVVGQAANSPLAFTSQTSVELEL